MYDLLKPDKKELRKIKQDELNYEKDTKLIVATMITAVVCIIALIACMINITLTAAAM